ncbi:hypothetical protein PG984_000276 [Apiospora sp. TS-2023a]
MFSLRWAAFVDLLALLAAMKHNNTGPVDSTPAIVHDVSGRELNLTENSYNAYNRTLDTCTNCNGESRSYEFGIGQKHFWLDFHETGDDKCWLFSVDDEQQVPWYLIAHLCRAGTCCWGPGRGDCWRVPPSSPAYDWP